MKRISWKKGMRLTDEVFRLSDAYNSEQLSNALVLGAAGRFGLFPQCSFNVSIDINGSDINVISLDCLALTRNGSLIDITYDSTYNNTFNTHAEMPQTSSSGRLLVSVCAVDGEWHETSEGVCEPQYAFMVTDESTPVQPNSMPIARLVSNGGYWRVDEEEFVPPCLYVSSHSRFIELASNVRSLLVQLNTAVSEKANSAGRDVLRVFWPEVMNAMITIDKEIITMTPMQLLALLQKCAGSFAIGYALSDNGELANANTFFEFAKVPYNYKEIYTRIQQGVSLLNQMLEKVAQFGALAPKPAPEPRPAPQRQRWSGMSI